MKAAARRSKMLVLLFDGHIILSIYRCACTPLSTSAHIYRIQNQRTSTFRISFLGASAQRRALCGLFIFDVME